MRNGEKNLDSADPMQIFEITIRDGNVTTVQFPLNEATKLLNYYLTTPVADVVCLNYKGDGYAVLGESLESLRFLNQLTGFVVGKMSSPIPTCQSTLVSYLKNYKFIIQQFICVSPTYINVCIAFKRKRRIQ